MPDPTQKMLHLAKRLADRTDSGDLSWTKVGEGDQYQALLGKQFVTVRDRDRDGHHPFVLTLWRQDPESEDGDEYIVVETVDTENLRGTNAGVISGVWTRARADALDINDSIDAALAALEETS